MSCTPSTRRLKQIMEEAEYDLVVFGVTGYTGKFVAEDIYRIQNSGRQSLKWAVAGRSEAKVAKALQDLGIEGVDIIVADVNDEESIETMCSRTRVLVDVVGPYVEFGEVVVRSCINQKCDYVDITGETYFVELMMSRYGEQAKEAGVYIVNYCGFDCIPNDLGTLVLHKAFNGELAYIESYVKIKVNEAEQIGKDYESVFSAEAINTGTWESMLRSIRGYKKLEELRKSTPNPRPKLPSVRPPKRRSVFYSDIAHSWCIPFLGADRACVLKSAQYRHEVDDVPMIRAQIYFCVGSLMRFLVMSLMFMIIIPLCRTNWGFNLLSKYPALFTFGSFRKGGPSKQQLKNASFSTVIDGAGFTADNTEKKKPDVKLRVRVRGAEPGYVATSAMLVQSAFCVLDERDKLPKEGGIYTPAVAFANTNIVQNLEATGKIKFTVEQLE